MKSQEINTMRDEKELRDLREKLEAYAGFIMSYGAGEESADKTVSFACDVYDALSWVLEEEPTEKFLSADFLNIKHLESLVRKIKKRTQNKFSDYQNESKRGLTNEETKQATKKIIESLKQKLAKTSERRKPALQKLIGELEGKTGMGDKGEEA